MIVVLHVHSAPVVISSEISTRPLRIARVFCSPVVYTLLFHPSPQFPVVLQLKPREGGGFEAEERQS